MGNNGTKGSFNGQNAKINHSDNGRRMDVYYGGNGKPDGPGHSHVAVVNDQIRYWRENGAVLIDEKTGEVDV